jgi:metal-responsive CopG/Arc/MetJ family transcriptional regulator
MSVRRPYTTCLNIELMTEIRELAQRKAKHQNELIEEAIQDLLRKYNDQDTIKPSSTGMLFLLTLPNNIS